MVEAFSLDIDKRAHRAFKKVKEDLKKLQEEYESANNSKIKEEFDIISKKNKELEEKFNENINNCEKSKIEILEKIKINSEQISFLISTQEEYRKDLNTIENKIKTQENLELNKRIKQLEQELILKDEFYLNEINQIKEHLGLKKSRYSKNTNNSTKIINKNLQNKENKQESQFKEISEQENEKDKKKGFFNWFLTKDEQIDNIEEIQEVNKND